MSTAQRILLVYGTVSIAAGMVLGLPLSRVRMSHPEGPRHLVTAHLAALMQGVMHVSLAFAVGFASLTPWVVTASAIALVCGSALFIAGNLSNWRRNVGDHFSERSQGFYLLSASGPFHLVGSLVILAGVGTAALR